jgi:hypothetical protein
MTSYATPATPSIIEKATHQLKTYLWLHPWNPETQGPIDLEDFVKAKAFKPEVFAEPKKYKTQTPTGATVEYTFRLW